jgi:cytochrome c oxidase subunit 3
VIRVGSRGSFVAHPGSPSFVTATAAARRQPPSVLIVGAVVWISSELLFFGTLFGAYFTLRSQSDGPWPPEGAHPSRALAALSTALLVSSSATVQLAARAAAERRAREMRRWLLATFGLGAAFLAILIHEWTTLEFSARDHAYGTIFFTLTGFHGLHVLGGLTALLVIAWRSTVRAVRHDAVEVMSLYWHFVDVVWLALFATVYLAG